MKLKDSLKTALSRHLFGFRFLGRKAFEDGPEVITFYHHFAMHIFCLQSNDNAVKLESGNISRVNSELKKLFRLGH